MKNTWLAIGLGAAIGLGSCQSLEKENGVKAFPSMEEMQKPFSEKDVEAFQSPAKVHYPETWFHYIGGNVSHEGITADLEAIASAGISGVQLFHGQFGGIYGLHLGLTGHMVAAAGCHGNCHCQSKCKANQFLHISLLHGFNTIVIPAKTGKVKKKNRRMNPPVFGACQKASGAVAPKAPSDEGAVSKAD